MTVWYVHRRDDGTIASAHEEIQPGYAEEALDDAASPLREWFDAIRNPVPKDITPLQLRRALNQMGLRSAVEAYVAQAGADVKDAWEFASAIDISDPLLVTAAKALNVSLPDLFRLAATFPRYR